MKKAKEYGIRIGLVIASIVAVIYGFEGYCRLSDSFLGVNGYKDGVYYTWGKEVRANNLTWRDDKDVIIPKPYSEYRIMVLGDSLTWGAGLSTDERYSDKLQVLLCERYPDRNIKVFNFGMSGGATVRERDWLYKLGDEVQPDLIIIGFCVNDVQSGGEDECVEQAKYRDIYNHITSLADYGLVKVSQILYTGYNNLLIYVGKMPTYNERLFRVYDEQSEKWPNFVKALQDIKAKSDNMSLSPPIFLVLNQGVSSTKPTDYRFPNADLMERLQMYHQATKAANEAGFTVGNVEKEFAEQLPNHVMAINRKDGHPDAIMNTIYAQKLYDMIVKRGYIED